MAITYTDNGTNTPNGTHKIFTYTFPVLKTEDIKVALNGIVQATTKYTASLSPAQIEFNSTNADATVQNTSTGAPLSNVLVRVYRQTTVGKNSGDEDPKAVFAAGSSIRATDLNANQEQALFAIHELQNQEVLEEKLGSGAVTSAKILDGTIVNADINASAAIAGTKISPDFGAQHITTTGKINMVEVTELQILDGATVTTDELNKLDGLTASTTELNKLDGFFGSTSDLNVLNGLTASNVELNKLDGATVTTAEINILDGVTATTAEINKLDGVTATTSELNILDGVTATATELNVLDGISVTTNELNNTYGIAGNIQSQLNNKQPLDAELTELATMSSGTASALADLTQAEVQTLDGITATATEINLNDGQTATSTEVNILDGATLNTTELNKLDGLTSSTTELNLLDGKSIVTSISGSATDTQIPSAQAVNERITTVVQDVGGFVPIANETSFPTTNPDLNDAAGTIVSIKALASAFTTGSGVTTHTISNGAGSGKNVTITGLTQSTTYPAGRGLILETTQYSGGGRGGVSTEYEYAFHRLTLDETGVADAQAAINDFDEKYYGPLSSNPATRPSGANRQNGDLYFNTSDGKMKVYNGSHASGTWDDVAAPGNFFINTLSSSSGSGGGQSAFNNIATRFTLSNPPLTAQQLLVSVNGVVQKPNSGTSPSEGFAIDGADIIFASAPATSAPFFIVTIGSSVNIGTPSNDTVGAAQIINGSIGDAEISSTAGIAKSKLASLNILDADVNPGAAIARTKLANVDLVDDTTPQLGGDLDTNGYQIYLDDNHNIYLGDSNDFEIRHQTSGDKNVINSHKPFEIYAQGDLKLRKNTGELYFNGVHSTGVTELYHNNNKKFETYADGIVIFNSANHARISFNAASGDRGYVYASNGNNIGFLDSDADWLVKGSKDAGVELFYNGSKKFETTASGVSIGDRLVIGSATHAAINANADDLIIGGGSGDMGMTIYSGTSNDGNIFFADGTSGAAQYRGFLQYQHSTNRMYFGTGGSTVLTLDENGLMGVGTSTPSSWNGDANRLVLYEAGTSTGMTIATSGNYNSNIFFADSDTDGAPEYAGYVQYSHSDDNLRLGASAGDRLRIAAGNVTLVGADLVIPSGNGISFAATSDASGRSSELLDDYEEGTWTPSWGTYAGSGQADGTFTYHSQHGQYIKIGRIVTCWFLVSYHQMSAVPVGSYARLKGFPFTIDSLNSSHNGATEGATLIFNWQNWPGNSAEDLTGFAHRGHNHVLFGHKTANSINAATPGEMFGNSTFGPVSNGQYYLYGQLTYVTG